MCNPEELLTLRLNTAINIRTNTYIRNTHRLQTFKIEWINFLRFSILMKQIHQHHLPNSNAHLLTTGDDWVRVCDKRVDIFTKQRNFLMHPPKPSETQVLKALKNLYTHRTTIVALFSYSEQSANHSQTIKNRATQKRENKNRENIARPPR